MAKSKKKTIPTSVTNKPDNKSVKYKKFEGDGKPSWRFSTVDLGGEFKWPSGTYVELKIINKLHHFDSMPWDEIEGNRHHFLDKSPLSKKAQERLCEIQKDDFADSVFSIALEGKVRIIMIREGDLAKLLWYDPSHQVCPSPKKHT